jgi:hypothetical protein
VNPEQVGGHTYRKYRGFAIFGKYASRWVNPEQVGGHTYQKYRGFAIFGKYASRWVNSEQVGDVAGSFPHFRPCCRARARAEVHARGHTKEANDSFQWDPHAGDELASHPLL